MKKENSKQFLLPGCFLAAFVLWTVLIRLVDVAPVGPLGRMDRADAGSGATDRADGGPVRHGQVGPDLGRAEEMTYPEPAVIHSRLFPS